MANATAAKASSIQPRFIRFGDAPGYLGMCRDEFNKTVRPHVREFPIGKQGVAFDRHELDEWADSYITAKAVVKPPIRTTIGLAASAKEQHNGAKNDLRSL